jgi:hypothetical protein
MVALAEAAERIVVHRIREERVETATRLTLHHLKATMEELEQQEEALVVVAAVLI